jgi:hypothetical protein
VIAEHEAQFAEPITQDMQIAALITQVERSGGMFAPKPDGGFQVVWDARFHRQVRPLIDRLKEFESDAVEFLQSRHETIN